MSAFLAAAWAAILGTLMHRRLLPFLRADTILSGGKEVPTEQAAHFFGNFLYAAAAVAFMLGLIGLLTLNEARRRYVAQLPTFQRWMIWPFVHPERSTAK